MLYDIADMWNLKKGTNERIHQTESQMQKTNLWLPGGKARGRDTLGDWD